MSSFMTLLGGALLALLLAGYYGQKYLPPPPPKIFGIDLGTTFSCIGAFHPGTGDVTILKNEIGKKCIPSVVAFGQNGEVLVGYAATQQAQQNPENTFFDAKRFIGKKLTKNEFDLESKRYPFKIELMEDGYVRFKSDRVAKTYLSPEQIGAEILMTLKKTAEKHFWSAITKVVMSVPAEFDQDQRAHTVNAGKLANLQVMRLINEPTAAALAYGLHNKTDVHDILVVDLGGGTLDVSLLHIQGGMFLTRAMAGNNRLGGQDFNERLRSHVTSIIEKELYKMKTYSTPNKNQQNDHSTTPDGKIIISDSNDIQLLRDAVEELKLALTFNDTVNAVFRVNNTAGTYIFDHAFGYRIFSPRGSSSVDENNWKNMNTEKSEKDLKNLDVTKVVKNEIRSNIDEHDQSNGADTRHNNSLKGSTNNLKLNKNNEFESDNGILTIKVDRETFNLLNFDLFLSILEPISRVIDDAELAHSDVEEIVLVGGSTRIPRVREIISQFFGGRAVRTDVDPEIAVAIGVSLQAGIMGGAWPLTVSALEIPYSAPKTQLL